MVFLLLLKYKIWVLLPPLDLAKTGYQLGIAGRPPQTLRGPKTPRFVCVAFTINITRQLLCVNLTLFVHSFGSNHYGVARTLNIAGDILLIWCIFVNNCLLHLLKGKNEPPGTYWQPVALLVCSLLFNFMLLSYSEDPLLHGVNTEHKPQSEYLK